MREIRRDKVVKWKYSIFILLIIGLLSCGEDEGPSVIDYIITEIIKGPYLGNVTRTSIVVSWETKGPCDALVEYATDEKYIASGGSYNQRAKDPGNSYRHSVILKNLIPSTVYHYRIVSDSIKCGDNTFHTAVEPSEPFTLVVYGDTRTNIHDHRAVVDEMIKHSPDLVLNTGDMVTDGRLFPLWDVFFLVIGDLVESVPYYTVLGNHEENAQQYYDLFYLPKGGGKEGEQWYSFDYGSVHFVCLDSDVRYSEEQLAWLEDDLSQASGKARWIFAAFHHPVYSSGYHGGEYDTLSDWVDAFERYGVDMVFNGHDHCYERSFDNDIWYILTGGGGAPLYPVNQNPNPRQVYAEMTLHFCKLRIDGAKIEFEMIRADGTVGDAMTVTESVVPAAASVLPFMVAEAK